MQKSELSDRYVVLSRSSYNRLPPASLLLHGERILLGVWVVEAGCMKLAYI